jgi:hypothetical protein
MYNSAYMSVSKDFEREKNIKALLITMGVMGALLLLFFLYRWGQPIQPLQLAEDGIEVNLGNSDQGLGDVQPLVPGDPSNTQEEESTPPPTSQNNEQAKDIDTDDNDATAPDVVKPNTPPSKPTNNLPNTNTSPRNNNAQPATNPTPKPRNPKALYKGGNTNGTGGNNADSYNNSRNQGVTTGTGDQGRPGGNPNSDNYNGNGGHGTSGASISRGLQGRRISGGQSFEDDFNDNATIFVDVTVDASGKVTSASFQPRGSTTTSSSMKSIAIRRAYQLKFNPGSDEQTGTVRFNFKVRG